MSELCSIIVPIVLQPWYIFISATTDHVCVQLGVQTREYTGELGTAKTGAREKYQAVELAMLERSLRDIYSKLSDSNNDRNSNCLSKHEATELLKLLQAATRK